MYLELVNEFRTTRKYGGEIKPRVPATEAEIARAEREIGIQFPQELRDLLLEMDGDCNLFLSLNDIVEYNAYPYSEQYPIGSLLIFGADGSGNLFAYKVKDKRAEGGEIYLWDHELAAWGPEEEELQYQASSISGLIQDFYGTCYGRLLSE